MSQVAIVQAGPYMSTATKLALTNADTPGNLLLAFAANTASSTAVTAPDGTWTPLLGAANGANNAWLGIWARAAASGDPTTFTFANSSRGRVIELSNAVAPSNEPSGYYGLTSNSAANATSLASSSVTPLETTDLAIACFQVVSNVNPSNKWTGGFAQLDISTNGSAKTEFATLSNPAANTALSTTEQVASNAEMMLALIVVKTGSAAPTAAAAVTPAQVEIGAQATFDGSGSTPANAGDGLSYQWTLTAAPAGSQAMLSSATSEHPTLGPDLRGTYTASLVVSDTVNSKSSANPATASFQAIGPVVGVSDGSEFIPKPLLRHRNGIWA